MAVMLVAQLRHVRPGSRDIIVGPIQPFLEARILTHFGMELQREQFRPAAKRLVERAINGASTYQGHDHRR